MVLLLSPQIWATVTTGLKEGTYRGKIQIKHFYSNSHPGQQSLQPGLAKLAEACLTFFKCDLVTEAGTDMSLTTGKTGRTSTYLSAHSGKERKSLQSANTTITD